MDLTEYEREREARIRKNQEALLKLEIPQLAPKQAVASKPRAPRSKRKPVEETTRRVSLRARGLAPDGTEAEKIKKEAELVAAQTRKRHSGTESFAGTLYEPDDYQDFDGDSDDSKRQNLVDSFAMKIRSSSGGVDERFSVGEDKKTGADRILDMKIIGEEPQRKVLVSRVYSINIHPRKDRILVGAGDTKGFFGLMYLDDESRPSLLRMEPHSRTITAIRSNAVETDQMYTTSHDCTLRRLDLTRQEFITIREDAEGDGSTDFNFIEPRVLAYCTSRGYVGVVDTRDKKHPSWENQLHDKKIGSISVCSKTNTLVTASNDCTVAVFDLRKVNRKSTLASFSHGRAVSNGVISENGQSILTTSYDDTLRIYSTVKGNWKDKPRVYKHDNNTGRWITKFKAEWYPQEPGVFVCGSMKRPHGLDVFDASTTEHAIAGKLMSEYLSAIPARHAFHPEMDVLATGNASGRLCIWTTSRKLAP